MWTIAEIKERGRAAFKANFWPSVIAAFLLTLFTSGTVGASSSHAQSTTVETQGLEEAASSLSTNEQALIVGAIIAGSLIIFAIALVLRIFLFNPLSVGCHRFFRKNVEDPTTQLGTIKEGFGDYGRVFITLLIRDIFITLWSLLLLIPGIMKAYSYRMVPYLVTEYPNLSPTEVLKRSSEMMRGNRMQAFLLDLSFIGWLLLGIVTFNLGNIFWTGPYHENANAALFLELDKNYR